MEEEGQSNVSESLEGRTVSPEPNKSIDYGDWIGWAEA